MCLFISFTSVPYSLASFWVLAALSTVLFWNSSFYWLFILVCLLLLWLFNNFHGLLSRLALYVFCYSHSLWMSKIPHIHVLDKTIPLNRLLSLQGLSPPSIQPPKEGNWESFQSLLSHSFSITKYRLCLTVSTS